MNEICIKVRIRCVDGALEKAQELLKKIEEAKTADAELASLIKELRVETNF